MKKTARSMLLQSFSRQPLLKVPSEYVSIVDMSFSWTLGSPTSVDGNVKACSGTDYLWRDDPNEVFLMTYSRHNNTRTNLFINNNYTVLKSSKDDKPERRASTNTNLRNVYSKEAEKLPSSSQFKQIMLKLENNVQLQKLLNNRFKAIAHLRQAELF